MFNGEAPDESSAWKYNEEASWGVPDRHYFQYFASLVDDSLSKIFSAGHPADSFWKVNTILIMIGLVCLSESINELASKYQALALKTSLKPAHTNSLENLFRLIDLFKPILNKTNVYSQFLDYHFCRKNIEPEKFDIILKHCPKGACQQTLFRWNCPFVYAVRQERFDLVQKLVFRC